MKQSPPTDVACVSTTASAAEAAIIASTSEPPRFSAAIPASVAAEWPETTMARRPNTGARGVRASNSPIFFPLSTETRKKKPRPQPGVCNGSLFPTVVLG